MKLTGKLAEQYVNAVERETERNRRYKALLSAQLSGDKAAIIAAQAAVDEIEGDGDY